MKFQIFGYRHSIQLKKQLDDVWFCFRKGKIQSVVEKWGILDFFQIFGEKSTDLNMVKCECLKILNK